MVDSFAAVAFPRWNFQFYSFSFKTIANSNRQIWCPFADAADKFIRLISLINSYFAFSFFSFFYDNVFAVRCMDASFTDAKKAWAGSSQLACFLIWSEHCSCIAEIDGSNPLQAWVISVGLSFVIAPITVIILFIMSSIGHDYWGKAGGTFERPVGIS